MKVALCFYGQPRFYDITYKLYYSKILETYNPDVFIHTWWSDEMIGTLYPCAKHAEDGLSSDDRLVKSDIIHNIKELYNPTLIQCDDYSTIEIPHKSNYYQYYTQYAVKELLSEFETLNNFEYDLVIRTRFDLLIQQDIPYHSDDFLWVSDTCPYTNRYNDMFSFSNSSNYKKISNVYKNLNYFEENNKGNMEWAFTSQVKNDGLNVKTFSANYSTFDILRTNTANKFRQMKYTIVGCITKYGVDDIKPYVESIKQSGFNGDKLMLVYDVSSEVVDYLQTNGWLIAESQLQEHIILQRFRDMYALLHQYNTDVIIWTDVKDVIFQKDPTEWLEKNMKKNILAFSECVVMKNEPWACVNSGTTFPMEWEFGMKDQISYCAGTIVGKSDAMRDLFIEIYRWSKTTANPQQLSDQAAFNILIRLEHFKSSVQFVNQNEGFATQLGVVFMRDENQLITEEKPIYKDGRFYTVDGKLFSIVHQYDRNEIIKNEIKNKYK